MVEDSITQMLPMRFLTSPTKDSLVKHNLYKQELIWSDYNNNTKTYFAGNNRGSEADMDKT